MFFFKLTNKTLNQCCSILTLGNVWRFPTLAYENGGGSFFIAYFILLLLIGKPMYYMELVLGQFAQRGPVGIWKMCPLGNFDNILKKSAPLKNAIIDKNALEF